MGRKPRGDYAVGYSKPPEHGRFKPGQSGNPKGRPKGSVDLGTLLIKALAEKVVVKEGGRRRVITKAEATAKQIVNKAANGDPRAIKILMEMERRCAATLKAAAEDRKPTSVEQQTPQPDLSRMTTKELTVLYEAACILEGQTERPPIPTPPGDPEEM